MVGFKAATCAEQSRESQFDYPIVSSGIAKPDEVHVAIISSALSTVGSDVGGKIVDTKRRQNSREDR